MNGSNYFSTVEAAAFCQVTRFTILNWIKRGLLKANRTAGGHRRILMGELLSFMRLNNMDATVMAGSNGISSPADGFKWCWEYYQKEGYKNHKCRGCLVFLTHTKKCFSLRKKLGHKRIFCNSECETCSYHKEYFNSFKWCWEYHQENGCEDHSCADCVVYLTGTKKCFALREETNHKKIYCKKTCGDCSYYKLHRGVSANE